MEVDPNPPQREDFRAFFYGLFGEGNKRRRFILQSWHSTTKTSSGSRLSTVFETFLKCVLLYDTPPRFSMRNDHFCLLDNDDLRIPYAWLTEKEREFIVYSVYGHRETLFKCIKRYENNAFLLDDFVHNSQQLYDWVWGREIARDFAWLVASKRQPFLVHELIVALQSLMTSHNRGRKDVFLKALHDGLQGSCELARVPCWGLEAFDLHNEEREGR
jgi:hypothetical protein